ncbi:hypothetical protein RDWZM_004815 [Blomia tropicalis]|uniref:Uncharacterized protein n=1 Tax=Blomia tropicalis TaxID=40697 RepID=A0A9Q0M2T7_BLOTA|nr:hypothetical protein RDWZM_004815 [Blomia tropicalis]
MWVIDLENIDKSRSTMLYTLYDNSIKEVDENPYNMIDDLHDVSYRFMSTYQAKTVMIQLLDNNNQLYKTIIAETLYNEKRNYHLKKNKTLQICEQNNGTEVVLLTDERKECKMIQFPKQSQLMTGFINENGQMFLMSNDNVWIILSNLKALKFQENSNKSFRLFQKSLEQFFSCDTNGKMTTTEGIRIFFYASTIIVVILTILVLFLFIYTSPILKNNTRHGGTSPSRTEKTGKKGKNEKEVKQNYDQITTIPQQKKEVSSKRLLNVNGKEHPTNESNGQLKEAKQKNMTNNMKNKLSSAKNRIVDQSHSISKTRRLPVTTDSRSIVSNSKKNVSNRKTRSRKISGKVALKSAKTRKNKNVSGGKIVDGQRSRSLRKSTKMAVESKRKTIKEGSDPLVNDSSNASSNLSN